MAVAKAYLTPAQTLVLKCFPLIDTKQTMEMMWCSPGILSQPVKITPIHQCVKQTPSGDLL